MICPNCDAEDVLTPWKDGTGEWFCPTCGENVHEEFIIDVDA